MPSYPARALVLRKTKLAETDTILTLLASDGRQLRAVAKGLRKPGGRFGARLEPYAICDLLLHTGRSLEVVTEAQTVVSHAALRENLDRSAAAAVVVDLLDKISVEGQAEPRLFALAETTLQVFDDAAIDSLPALVIAFLVKAMAMHGYRPQLDACVHCAADAHGACEFSVASGGVLCPECGRVDAGSLRFGPEGRAWLESLLGATMSEVAGLDMPPAAVADCFDLLRAFIAYHLPARLRALDFYAGLIARP